MEEKDCVDMILKFYEENCQDDTFKVDDEVWIHNATYLRKLMKRLDEDMENYENIKNCLILLINLCFGIENADRFESTGKPAKELSNLEKENYKSLLRKEEKEGKS